MNVGLLKSVHQAVNSIVPKILSVHPMQSVLTHRIHYICDRQRLNNSSNPSYNIFAFLQPILPIYNSICGMKTKGRLQLRCKDCYFIWRRERKYVMCKTHPRHKQAQIKKQEYKTWIVTSASQSKKREW